MNTKAKLRTTLAAVFAVALCSACAIGNNVPEITHDGLQLVPNSKMERTWVKPGEDFSQYSSIGLLGCYVAFKKNWQTNHPGIHKRDMDEISKWLNAEIRKVFTGRIIDNGYSIATAPAKDVLTVRPSLVGLEITAPDTRSDESSMTFTTSTGSLELYLEVFDSESGEILARATDRRQLNHIGDVEVSSFSINSDDAQRLVEHWADILISELNAELGKSDD